jgi:hypothetical protein
MAEDMNMLRLRAMAKAKAESELETELTQQAELPTQAEPDLEDKAMEMLGTVAKKMEPLQKPLAYPGGWIKEALAKTLVEPRLEREIISREEALKGEVPSGAKLLETKFGMGPGSSLSDYLPSMYSETGKGLALQKGGLFDPTARGFYGAAIDAFTDPFTLFGLGNAGKISKAVETAGQVLPKTGAYIYKNAPTIRALDSAAVKLNKRIAENVVAKPSDVLLKYGVSGSNKNIVKEAEQVMADLYNKREGILKAADEAGATVDVNKAMAPYDLEKAMIEKGKNPYKKQAAKKVEGMISDYRDLAPREEIIKSEKIFDPLKQEYAPKETLVQTAQAPLKPSEMADINADFYKKYKDAYRKGDVGKLEDDLIKQQGFGAKKAIEESVEKAIPGMGKELSKTNSELSSLLTVTKKLGTEGAKEGKKVLTEVDAIVGTFNPWAMAAKQGAKALGSNTVRTMAGKGIYSLGKGIEPILTPLGKGLAPVSKVLATPLNLPPQLWLEMLRNKQGEQK